MGVIWSDLEALTVSLAAAFCILDSLKSIKKVLRYTREQSITIVQSGKYKGLPLFLRSPGIHLRATLGRAVGDIRRTWSIYRHPLFLTGGSPPVQLCV